MAEADLKHSTMNGTASYANVNNVDSRAGCRSERMSNECEFQPKLVIVEGVGSEEKSDESFQNETACESSDILSFGNGGLPVDHIKSDDQAAGATSLSIKIPLGRYEISKVSRPQINLKASNAMYKAGNSPVNFISVTKPRTTPAREAVDPAKYYILNDEPDGTKYACSKCGNVYKWRKSLNKHWKEKHDGEAPPSPAERERLFKRSPQNFQKHSALHVVPAVNTVGTKNILFPASVSLANFKSPNQIRIPTSMYTLVNISKAEVVTSRSHGNQSEASHGTIWKSQICKSVDFSEVSPAHQTPSNAFKHMRSTGVKLFDNLGVLDLSVKGSLEQEKPLDFSTRSTHERRDEEKTPNDLSKNVEEASSDSDYYCFQCRMKFIHLLDLNSHFACHHMNSLYQMADDNISTLNSKDHISFQAQRFPMKSSEIIECVICGHSERWEWQMAKHFEDEHYGIEPNPYKTSNLSYSGIKITTPSPPRSPGDSNGFNGHSLNAEVLKNFGLSDNNVFDLESQGTAIVIPKAPEETASITRNVSHRHKSQETSMFNGEGNGFMPDSLEESSTPSETVRVAFTGKSGRGKKENSLYNGDVVLPYECQLCGYRARWPSEMTQHMKNHSDEKPYQCPQCTYRSKWKWDVVKHLKRCGGSKDQTESSQKRKRTFPKAFPEVSSSDSNNDGSSNGRTSSSETFQKEIISRVFQNATHFSNDRPKKKCYEEGLSPQRFDVETTSASNSSTDHHSNLHPCDQCYFIGHSPAELKRHLRVHSDEKPYSCNTCSYSSKWKCDLKKHLRTYNHIPNNPMDQGTSKKPSDGQVVCNGAEVSQDERMLLGEEVFVEGRMKCKQCPFEAINMMGFFEHVNKHIKEFPADIKRVDGGGTENCKADSEENKIKLMSSLGLHQVGSDESLESRLEFHRNGIHKEVNKERFENPEIKEGVKGQADEQFNSRNSTPSDNTKILFQENQVIDCSSNTASSFNSSTCHESSSSNSKVSPKLFTLQDLVINEVRLKLIIKSNRHFYGCIKCPYVSLSSFRAIYHSRLHGSRKTFKCFFCDYSNDQLTFIQKHTASLHGEENNNVIKKSSDSNFNKPVHFRVLQQMNLSLRKNICINCGYASLNRAAVVKHRLTRPCSQLVIRHPVHLHAGDVFSCHRCSFKTDERLAMVNHSKGHSSSFQHKCLQCDFSSNVMNVILIHRNHQHGSKY